MEKEGNDPKHSTSSIRHDGGSVMGMGVYDCQSNWSLVCSGVTADRSSLMKMKSEVYRAKLSAKLARLGTLQDRRIMTQNIP